MPNPVFLGREAQDAALRVLRFVRDGVLRPVSAGDSAVIQWIADGGEAAKVIHWAGAPRYVSVATGRIWRWARMPNAFVMVPTEEMIHES